MSCLKDISIVIVGVVVWHKLFYRYIINAVAEMVDILSGEEERYD